MAKPVPQTAFRVSYRVVNVLYVNPDGSPDLKKKPENARDGSKSNEFSANAVGKDAGDACAKVAAANPLGDDQKFEWLGSAVIADNVLV